MKTTNRRRQNIWGAMATMVVAVLFTGCCFGFDIFAHWQDNFFAPHSDDAAKEIYTTAYHAAYSENLLQCTAMNYPHGEYYTYTGMQAQVAVPLWLLRHIGVDNVERWVLPLVNLQILLGIVLCALFLYLLLRAVWLPQWYAVVGALLITFLSPQLQRIGGHLSLSYVCALPMLLYLLLRQCQSRSLWWSAAYALVAFWFAMVHPYYLVFFIAVPAVALAWKVVTIGSHRRQMPWSALFIQLLVPLLLFWLCTHIGDTVTDRTSMPWGFRLFRGCIKGLLLPYTVPLYGKLMAKMPVVQWETMSYIGLVAVVGIISIAIRIIVNLFRRRWKQVLRPTRHPVLNLFFGAGLLLALMGCVVPLLPPQWIQSFGPLAQLRAQGRLLWIFYYVVNIAVLYYLYNYVRCHRDRMVPRILMAVALLIFAVECWSYNSNDRRLYRSQWTEWTDGVQDGNFILDGIDAAQYQAILNLPVFNSGSEFMDIWPGEGLLRKCAVVSVRTGLPLVSNTNPRSSASQAWECIALSRIPWRDYVIVDNLKDERPLLVMTSEGSNNLNCWEQALLDASQPVSQIGDLHFSRLTIDDIRAICRQAQDSLQSIYDSGVKDGILLVANGHEGDISKLNVVYDGFVSLQGDVELSFWMTHLLDDLYSRSTVSVTAFDNVDNAINLYCGNAMNIIDIIDGRDGLLRLRCTLPNGYRRLRITVQNPDMRHSPVTFSNLLLVPPGCHHTWYDGRKWVDNIPVN